MLHPLRFVSGAALALVTVAGCDAYVEPAQAPPAYVETTGAPAGPDADGDVVYMQDAPVDDIDSYPATVYGGVTVYFVGGTWYRHDERGWGEYRREPPELAHQRESHDRDPQWQRARQAAPRAQRVEPQNGDRGAPPARVEAAPRMEPVPQQAAPPARAEEAPRIAPRPEVAQPRPQETPAPQPRAKPPVRRAAPVRQPPPRQERAPESR